MRSLRPNAPMSRFSITVMPGKIPRPSGACEMPRTTRMCAFILVMSSPSKRIDPFDGFRMPEIVFIVVDLPAPFAPIRLTISPSSTENDMSWMASMRP